MYELYALYLPHCELRTPLSPGFVQIWFNSRHRIAPFGPSWSYPTGYGLLRQLRSESVPDPPHGLYAGADVAELAAEPDHLRVHRPIQPVEIRAPQPLQQELAREGAAGMLQQQLEEVHLALAEIQRRPGERGAMPDEVEHQGAECKRLRGVRGGSGAVEGHAPQQRSHAGGQLDDREGLAEVVVGPDLQPGDAVGHLAAGREHEDRHQVLPPQLPADGETIQAREHPVEDDEVGAGVVGGGERLPAVEGLLDGVPLLFQVRPDEAGQRRLIFDDEDPRHLVQDCCARRRLIQKVLPRPGWDVAERLPPMASRKSRAIDNPRPKPPVSRARELSAR